MQTTHDNTTNQQHYTTIQHNTIQQHKMPQQHRSAERSTLGLTFEDLGANDTWQYDKSTTQQQDNTIQHNTTQYNTRCPSNTAAQNALRWGWRSRTWVQTTHDNMTNQQHNNRTTQYNTRAQYTSMHDTIRRRRTAQYGHAGHCDVAVMQHVAPQQHRKWSLFKPTENWKRARKYNSSCAQIHKVSSRKG